MTNQNAMLDEAIAALSRAAETMGGHRLSIDAQLQQAKERRKAFLQSEVERRIPEISGRVAAQLILDAPHFMTASVRKTFKANRKVFGLFARAGYQPALIALQAKFMRYLEVSNLADTQSHNEAILDLQRERDKLDQRLHDTSNNLQLLTSARKKNIEFPAPVRAQITQIVEQYRQHQAGKRLAGPRRLRSDNVSSHSHHGGTMSADTFGNDLWFYLLTDIPTSVRTLMLNSFSGISGQHHEHSSGHNHHHESESRSAQSMAGASTLMMDLGSNLPTAEVAAGAIATDDSLGAFS